MSKLLTEVVRRVRYHLRDRNPQNRTFSDHELRVAIAAEVNLMAGELELGEAWDTAFLSVVAGTDAYTASSSNDYDRITFLRKQSDGLMIEIVSPERFEAYREGDTASASSTGDPQVAMLYINDTGGLNVRLWPTPSANDTLDAFRAVLPTGLLTASGAISASLASLSVPFDDAAFEALCYRVAARKFDAMTDEEKARHGLGANASATWIDAARSGLAASRRRRRRFKRPHARSGRRW